MENIPNCFYRISLKALILNETRDKFLILEEHDGRWDFPGGGLDFGESPTIGITRELKEEMGVDVVSVQEKPSYFLTDKHRSGYWIANIFYEVTVKDLDFTPSDECISLQFVSPEEVKNMNVYSTVKLFSEMFKV